MDENINKGAFLLENLILDSPKTEFFVARQIIPRSLGSWCVKGTEEFSLEVDSSVLLTHHDPKDLRLICLVKKRKMHFRILKSNRRFFLKKCTLSSLKINPSSTAIRSLKVGGGQGKKYGINVL